MVSLVVDVVVVVGVTAVLLAVLLVVVAVVVAVLIVVVVVVMVVVVVVIVTSERNWSSTVFQSGIVLPSSSNRRWSIVLYLFNTLHQQRLTARGKKEVQSLSSSMQQGTHTSGQHLYALPRVGSPLHINYA